MVELNTSDHILTAAMELFSEKGYAAVTTKEIAAKAQVSEVTLFRYFETKKALYYKVFDRYVFEPSLDDAFHQEPIGNLRTDLTNIALSFQNMIKRNFRLIKINMKDNRELFDFEHDANYIKKFPSMVQEKLLVYFTDMKKKGKIIGDPEILAVDFILVNVGLVLSRIYGDFYNDGDDIQIDKYIDSLTDIFIRGISI
jgi:AcrR family transcriptional regulator